MTVSVSLISDSCRCAFGLSTIHDGWRGLGQLGELPRPRLKFGFRTSDVPRKRSSTNPGPASGQRIEEAETTPPTPPTPPTPLTPRHIVVSSGSVALRRQRGGDGAVTLRLPRLISRPNG